MILHHWQGHAPNFGDELNTLLWPRLLPDFFDADAGVRFLGIGSILDARHPPGPVKVVAGAGYAGYEAVPRLDDTWIIHWVRGPLTAAALGLPPSLALGDPASLLPAAIPCPAHPTTDIGFMPHFESLSRGPWHRAAALAGLRLIDPRDAPETVIGAIRRCRVLLSESLHGAVVADALRVPWIPLRPLAPVHRIKWHDWAGTLGLALRPLPLPASSGGEWLAVSRLASRHRMRKMIERYNNELNAIWPERLLAGAVDGLRRAAAAEPLLSADTCLERSRARMLEALARLRREPLRCAARHTVRTAPAAGLRPHGKTEYQLRPVG